MRLRLARHPNRLENKHPILIEELLDLELRGKQAAVTMMLEMLKDLHEKGRGSRYLRKLTDTPLWELKSASRGGEKGDPGSTSSCWLTMRPGSSIVR